MKKETGRGGNRNWRKEAPSKGVLTSGVRSQEWFPLGDGGSTGKGMRLLMWVGRGYMDTHLRKNSLSCTFKVTSRNKAEEIPSITE